MVIIPLNPKSPEAIAEELRRQAWQREMETNPELIAELAELDKPILVQLNNQDK